MPTGKFIGSMLRAPVGKVIGSVLMPTGKFIGAMRQPDGRVIGKIEKVIEASPDWRVLCPNGG